MNHRRGCSPIYKGYGASLKGLDPALIHRKGMHPFIRVLMNHGRE